MQIVTFVDIHKSFGQEIVFKGLNEKLFANQKVGLIGANGSGKTTLLKLILGQIEPDEGQVVKRKSLNIGYLPQESVFSGELTVMEEMHAGVKDLLDIQERIHAVSEKMESLTGPELQENMQDYERLNHAFELQGGYEYEARISTILAGLGFDQALHHEKTSTLSGGQLSRLGLARVLLSETDMLLLDEPTNHLDLQAVEWLEKFIRNYQGAALIISHDRYLLDRVAVKIIEVKNGRSKQYKGNYTAFVEAKKLENVQQAKAYKQRSQMVEKTVDFINRNRNQKGMQGTARGRSKQLKRTMQDNPDYLAKTAQDKKVRFSFAKATSGSELIMRCEFLTMSFGDLTLFKNITFDLLAGDKLGITGPNGTGKSTFLKLALRKLKPTDGIIRMGKSLRVGYLDQHAETLSLGKTVLEEVATVRPDMSEVALRSKLGAFLFCGDDVLKRVESLSGGQQSRLMLCKLVFTEPDVLILDEPTNHLDIPGKEILEEAIKSYQGTVIVVSHDRFFLDRTVDQLLVMGVDLLGEKKLGSCQMVQAPRRVYSRYAEILQERLEQEQLEQQASQKGRAKKSKGKTAPPKPKNAVPKELKQFNKLSLEQIEEKIIEMEDEIPALEEKFGDENVYKQHDMLADLHRKVDEKKAELQLLYRAYEIRG